jgi:sugar phosphate isomerase/epimerase
MTAADGPVPLRAGLCSISLRALSAEQVIECATAAGLAGVEWGGDIHVPAGSTARAEEVARKSADAGLESPSYGSYVRAGKTSAADVGLVLDTAQALGAPNVRIWCELGVTPGASDADRSRVVAGVSEFVHRAAERGLTTSLEYHVDTLTHTAESAVRVLDDVDHPALFTYWQPDWTLAEDERLAEFARVLPRVSHIHAFSWRSYEDRLPLRDGASMWQAVLGSAVTPGSWSDSRYVFLEHVVGDEPAQVVRDAATLLDWLRLGTGASPRGAADR